MVRIPRNELLDALFSAFEEYDYWSMKNLVGLLMSERNDIANRMHAARSNATTRDVSEGGHG